MNPPDHKIFGIGLSKTGTTSLAHALELLGYKTRDYPGIARYQPGDLTSIDATLLAEHDALTDTPIPSFYRELDAHFPGAKFILTVRDREGWLKSCKKQFNEAHAASQNAAHKALFTNLYGTTVFDEAKFTAGYQRYVTAVLDYFKERPADLLVIDVTAGEGWEKLCPFLGQPTPDRPFPKANVTQITWIRIDEIVAIARQAGQILLRAQRQTRAGGLTRLWTALRGGPAAAVQRAARDSRRHITDSLRRVNQQVPLVARDGGKAASGDTSARWNHFWLVDPLDGERAFAGDAGEYTVNIALIQDGAPLYGVVYTPSSDTVYYARARKGAFVQVASGQSVPLPAAPAALAPTPALPAGRGDSVAGLLCRWLAESRPAGRLDGPCKSWEIAAAALILDAGGRSVKECADGQALNFTPGRVEYPCLRVV